MLLKMRKSKLSTMPQAADALPPGRIDPLVPTIFHEPWWLDIATQGHYGTVEISANNAVVGRMPYLIKRKMGIAMSFMPPLTHFLGPAVDEGTGSANTRFLKRLAVTREIINKMPKLSTVRIHCHRQVKDVIAFQEQGFQSTVQFTHEIAPQPEAEIWSNMRDKTRNVIRRAQERLTVSKVSDPAKFMAFYESTLGQLGKDNVIDRDICIKLLETCLTKQCGAIFGAYNDKGQLIAAIACVWDRTSYFYLMSSRQPNSGNNAISLLVWEAIKDANARNLIFDFDGLAAKGSILFFTGFGGMTSPRYIVQRSNKPMRAFQEMKALIRGENSFC
jgi:hypothetical protein